MPDAIDWVFSWGATGSGSPPKLVCTWLESIDTKLSMSSGWGPIGQTLDRDHEWAKSMKLSTEAIESDWLRDFDQATERAISTDSAITIKLPTGFSRVIEITCTSGLTLQSG